MSARTTGVARGIKQGDTARFPQMLTVSQLSKSFAGRALLDDVSLQVKRGDRIGLVGPNGAGKSTLFALLLGDVSPDKGTIAIEKNATIGFLPQETAAAGDETVLELALAVSPELVHAQKVIKAHEEAVAGMADPGADAAYHDALHVFDEHGGWELEPKAKRVLAGLAFRETDFDRPARALSGSWIMRAHLARLLVMQPDLLLLDEPTNHLDLESLQWFQEYLLSYPGAIVMISHDREFLNQLVGSVVEIAHSKLVRYRGDWDSYIEQKAAREDDQVPFPATGAQRPPRDRAERCRSCLRRPRCLSRTAISRRARTTHRP